MPVFAQADVEVIPDEEALAANYIIARGYKT
jgi:hypothetical protein